MNGFLENLITYFKAVWQGVKLLKNTSLSSIRKVFSLMGKKEKLTLFCLLIIAILNFFWSAKNIYYRFTVSAPALGGSLSEGVKGQPVYLNPILAFQEPDLSLTRLIFSGLYKYDNHGELVPDLAESLPKISEDQKTYTVNLKQNVKWHNGRTFNADDVVFTIQILKDPSYKSPIRNQWLSTKIEKLSEYEIRFTTQDVSAPFLNNLTLGILPEFDWIQIEPQNFHLSELNLKPIGTGPYVVSSINKLQSGKIQAYILESFSNFYLKKPKIDTLEIKFYENEGELIRALQGKEIQNYGYSSLNTSSAETLSRTDIQTFIIPVPQYQVLFFNLNHPILAEKAVRQSLAQSVNKNQIISQIFNSHTTLPLSPLQSHFGEIKNFNQPDFNPEAARAKLETAGWKFQENSLVRSKKTQSLKLTLVTNDMPQNIKAAQIITQNWKDVGVETELKILPSKQLNEEHIRPRNFDVLFFPQKFANDPDPFAFWHSSQIKDPGLNLSAYQNPVADKLITEARTNLNREIRKTKYEQLENLLGEELPGVFVDQAQYIYIVDKTVKNVGLKTLFDPQNRFYDIANWHIKEQRIWK